MAQTITLTKEEIALIEQKRAEDKAKEKALRASYDHYKAEKIKDREKRINSIKKDAEALKKIYEGFFNGLIAVSPDFKLDCKIINNKEVIDLYEIDNDGYEIQMLYDSEGNPKKKLKPKEKISLDSYTYEFSLSYTGTVPEGYSFYVIAAPTYSKYSGRANGYKMQVQGTGINSWEKTFKMTSPKSILNRIVGLSESAFMQIEHRNAAELTQQRIEAAFEKTYGHLENEGVKISVAPSEFTLKYENGIELKIAAYERTYENNSEVRFVNSKVKIPYEFDIDKLIEGLKNF
jgi:hypothetical protein